MGTTNKRAWLVMKQIPELKETFLDVFSRLPEKEKGLPIVVINHRGIDQPCSWRVVKLEAECTTPIGKRMLRQLERLEII